MEKSKSKVLWLVQLAMLVAILAILQFTPLGFLRIGVVEITFLVIPVVVGALMIGPLAGGILGLVFGLFSLSLAPAHPLFGVAFVKYPILVAVVCIVPRVLVGLIPAYIFKLMKNFKNQKFVYALCGAAGSLVNTVLFLGGVMLLLKNAILLQMTEMGLLSEKGFYLFWASIGAVNGIPELVACTFLVMIILIAVKKRRS